MWTMAGGNSTMRAGHQNSFNDRGGRSTNNNERNTFPRTWFEIMKEGKDGGRSKPEMVKDGPPSQDDTGKEGMKTEEDEANSESVEQPATTKHLS